MSEQEIGVVTLYYSHLQVGIIQLSAALKTGDTVRIKGIHDDFTQIVDSMQVEHKKLEQANAGDFVGVKMSQKAHEHDKVYRVE